MLKWIFCGALFLALAIFVSANSNLQGSWIGTLEISGQTTPIYLSAADDREAPSNAEIPFIGISHAKVRLISSDPQKLEFQLEQAGKSFRFTGRQNGTTISGNVPDLSASFTLRHVFTLTPDQQKDFFGIYEAADGSQIYIRTWDELGDHQLTYFKEDGEVGALHATSRSEFFTGPGIMIPLPEQASFTFKNSAKEVSVQDANGQKKLYKRSHRCLAEEIHFQSNDVELAGTLFEPKSDAIHAAMVLVHGSGPVTRDFYGPIGYYFASHGIATLTYDKRGMGGSSGNWMEADFQALAADAISAAEFLQKRPELRGVPLGLWGISQGGWIAPLASSKTNAINFLVLVSAASVTPAEQQLMSVEANLQAEGTAAAEIEKAVKETKSQFDLLRSEETRKELEAQVREMRKSGKSKSLAERSLENPLYLLFLRSVIDYDPNPPLEKLHVPVLFVYGEQDVDVPPAANRPKFEARLKQIQNQQCKFLTFPKANHALLESKTGANSEFPKLKCFAPGYFKAMSDWILQQKRTATK